MPLVFVPTPLGNLGDITVRALEVLRGAGLLVAEDTRVARKLLHALGIGGKEIWSYREQNAVSVTAGILERARTGVVAVVSDAGMPGISDPGSDLVAAAREAGVTIDVLPGPSAVTGVALLCGFPLARFIFQGFPPRASAARRAAFREALALGVTSIWYESPQRIVATLADIAHVASDCRVFLAREYTKHFEEQLLGSPAEVSDRLVKPIRGEVSFAIAPYRIDARARAADIDVAGSIDAMLDEGCSVREIAKRLAERGAGERRKLYADASDRKRSRGMVGAVPAEDPQCQ